MQRKRQRRGQRKGQRKEKRKEQVGGSQYLREVSR